jgi:hypothetical protein
MLTVSQKKPVMATLLLFSKNRIPMIEKKEKELSQ